VTTTPEAPAANRTTHRQRAEAFSAKWGVRIAYTAMALSLVVFTVIAYLVVTRTDHLGADAAVGLVAALVPGVITVVVSGFGHLNQLRAASEREHARETDLREREEVRFEELVLKSLEYFTGKTQRRSVGIAIVEGAWAQAPDLHRMFVPLLANQAVYLLNESGQTRSSHETDNLTRIMALLTRDEVVKGYAATAMQPVRKALEGRRVVQPGERTKGVAVPGEDVEAWLLLLPQ
jgi:hypothetical protein